MVMCIFMAGYGGFGGAFYKGDFVEKFGILVIAG